MASQPGQQQQQQQQRENIIFSDRFVVTDVNKEGHKFDRVSRIHATSENGDAELVLDYNSEIYSLKPQAVFMLVLVQSLSTMYTPQLPASELKSQKILDNWRDKQTTKTLADEYDYVMHGKVYKIDDDGNHRLELFVSFGGLLMCLKADYRQLQNVLLGEHIYLLIRK